jgi:hypothetical protein
MYNIGLDVINQTSKTNESLGSVIANLNDHFSSLSELVNIKQSLIKYGRTDQLVELVQPTLEELNTTCSIEGISTTLSNIWKWIMDTITNIINWIKKTFLSIATSIEMKFKQILDSIRKTKDKTNSVEIPTLPTSDEISLVISEVKVAQTIITTFCNSLNPTVYNKELNELTKDKLNSSIQNLQAAYYALYVYKGEYSYTLQQLNIVLSDMNNLFKVVSNNMSENVRLLNLLKTKLKVIETTMKFGVISDPAVFKDYETNVDNIRNILTNFLTIKGYGQRLCEFINKQLEKINQIISTSKKRIN